MPDTADPAGAEPNGAAGAAVSPSERDAARHIAGEPALGTRLVFAARADAGPDMPAATTVWALVDEGGATAWRGALADGVPSEWCDAVWVLRDPVLEAPAVYAHYAAAGQAPPALADWFQLLASFSAARTWSGIFAEAEAACDPAFVALADNDPARQAHLMARVFGVARLRPAAPRPRRRPRTGRNAQ